MPRPGQLRVPPRFHDVCPAACRKLCIVRWQGRNCIPPLYSAPSHARRSAGTVSGRSKLPTLRLFFTPGPRCPRGDHLALLLLVALPQGHRRIGLALVSPREAEEDAVCGPTVATAAHLSGLPHGELICLSRLLMRGLRQWTEFPPCGLWYRVRHGYICPRRAARVARHPALPRGPTSVS